MAKHPRLDDLGFFVIDPRHCLGVLVHYRVLNANAVDVLKIEKPAEELSPFSESTPTRGVCAQPPHSAVAQVRTRWVSDDEIPLLLEQFSDIAFDVKRAWWFTVNNVAGVCLDTGCKKCIADNAAELACNENSRHV